MSQTIPVKEEDVHALIQMAQAWKEQEENPPKTKMPWYASAPSILPMILAVLGLIVWAKDTRDVADRAHDEIVRLEASLGETNGDLEAQISGVKSDLEKRIDRENGDITKRLERIESYLLELIGDNGEQRSERSRGAADNDPRGTTAPTKHSVFHDSQSGRHTVLVASFASGGGPGVAISAMDATSGHQTRDPPDDRVLAGL